MKRLAVIAILLIMGGCHNSLENATYNMKKGDAFYETKEYDVAEYYYDKIPEESPLYAQARAKLDSIASFRKYWSVRTVSEEDLKKIVLADHSASMNKSTMKPLHSFVIINNTSRTLSSITVEFTYFDMNYHEVGKLTCDVDAPVGPKKKGVFNRVEPGTLTHTFHKSEAKLVGAQY
ncbi:MAG TPA: hypothetical protein VK470_05285 [Bacteroidota bacterium]|nr:hypothetical protein [Bacteroidota bacterium]